MPEIVHHPLVLAAHRNLKISKPADTLSQEELQAEKRFYFACLDAFFGSDYENYERWALGAEKRALRWSGIAFAVAGIPLAFADFVVGFGSAVAGFAQMLWSMHHGQREKSRERMRAAVGRQITARLIEIDRALAKSL